MRSLFAILSGGQHEPRRSIHQYQAQHRPWENVDLVLERIEEETSLPTGEY